MVLSKIYVFSQCITSVVCVSVCITSVVCVTVYYFYFMHQSIRPCFADTRLGIFDLTLSSLVLICHGRHRNSPTDMLKLCRIVTLQHCHYLVKPIDSQKVLYFKCT